MAVSKKTIKVFILIPILTYICSGWFRTIVVEDKFIALVFLLNIIFFVSYFFNKGNTSSKLPILIYILLLILQFKTVSIKNTYTFTPSEIDLQITRMNFYPPGQARLGYILENKKEVKLVEKVKENFIDAIDFSQYFPAYFSYLTFPFFLIGLFWFDNNVLVAQYKNKSRVVIFYLALSVFALSLLGINGKYGPFLIFHIIFLFILFGIISILKKFNLYE